MCTRGMCAHVTPSHILMYCRQIHAHAYVLCISYRRHTCTRIYAPRDTRVYPCTHTRAKCIIYVHACIHLQSLQSLHPYTEHCRWMHACTYMMHFAQGIHKLIYTRLEIHVRTSLHIYTREWQTDACMHRCNAHHTRHIDTHIYASRNKVCVSLHADT